MRWLLQPELAADDKCGQSIKQRQVLAFCLHSAGLHKQALHICFCIDIHVWKRMLAFTVLQDREKPGHKVEVDEEYEDAEGNVYNRKTYEDLRRQGLI